MEYISITIYFALFTLTFAILGYNLLYRERVGGASQRLGIVFSSSLRRLLYFITAVTLISLIIIGFFLILSIFETINKF